MYSMTDGAKLDIDYKLKTRIVPAAKATIMPVTLQGKQIIPKNALKPKSSKPKGKGKGKGKGNGKKGKVPVNKDGVPIHLLRKKK